MSDFVEVKATKNSIANRKLWYGKGVNDAWYITQPLINGKRITCPYFNVWREMIKRCYAENYQRKSPTYVGCIVCEEWLLFSNFKLWMVTQDWKDKALDKDIIDPSSKMYSPDNCVFVPQAINNLLADHRNARGKYPQGVNLEPCGRFKASISIDGRRKNLGRYSTPEQAAQVYNRHKYNRLVDVAMNQTDERIKQGLILHAEKFKDETTWLSAESNR